MAKVGRPKKVKVVVEKPKAPEVQAPVAPVSNVTTRPTDGTVNDLVADKLPSLND